MKAVFMFRDFGSFTILRVNYNLQTTNQSKYNS